MTKVALVTGGGSGLGAAISQQLLRRGYEVAVHYHQNLDFAADVAIQADLTSELGAKKLRREFDASFSRLDLLINNAGVYHEKSFYDLSEADWFTELNSTATATYFTTREFVDLLRTSEGRIINIGDGSCDRPGARELAPAYHIGKTGVWMLTRSLAKLEAKHKVAVNMVSPGLLENSVDLESQEPTPAGRFGTFGDVLEAIDFLADANSAYVTGSNLVVGGGWNL